MQMQMRAQHFAATRSVAASRRPAVACSALKQDRGIAPAFVGAAAAFLLAGASPVYADVADTTAPGSNLGFMSNEDVLERRKDLHFARSFDGHVALENRKTSQLWDVKLDLKSPGTLLLRDPRGVVHYLAFDSLQQIDLSDDDVVGAITSSPWEANVTPIEAEDDSTGEVQRLELTREGFYELVSVVDP